jgi:hypothetical protein
MKYIMITLWLVTVSTIHAEVDQAKIKEWKSVTLKDGTVREWTSITRFSETGFFFMTASGGGSVKYVDMSEEMQKEIGFDPKAVMQSSAASLGAVLPSGTSAQAGAAYDQALKQNTADQQSIRSDIAQLRAEIAKSQALNPGASTSNIEARIARKEGEIKIKTQQTRVIQEQKTASMIGANIQPTGNPQVDAAVSKADEIRRAIAQKKIKKETILVQIIQAELQNPGSSIAGYQSEINYINRDIPVLEAELRAADAAVQAARAAIQAR